MASSIRGVHVSPGIYTKETELTYAAKSLGITTLGLVGETLKGPAFEPIAIENWRDFQTVFGGTSTEKFKDSQYPKYELPYIAKSYLSESNQLQVCRVLGLSGYNAGPAWFITAKGSDENSPYDNSVVAVLRSRGFVEAFHKKSGEDANESCGCKNNVQYDYQRFYVGEDTDGGCTETNGKVVYNHRTFKLDTVRLDEYQPINSEGKCGSYGITSNGNLGFSVSATNYGKFNIKIKLSRDFTKVEDDEFDYIYSVSLNPSDKDYILKVLGTNNTDGSAPLYVETLYDVALQQGIESKKIVAINDKLGKATPYFMSDLCSISPVLDLLSKPEAALGRSDIGKRFLGTNTSNTTFHVLDDKDQTIKVDGDDVNHDFTIDKNKVASIVNGDIYTVRQMTLSNGKRKYIYIKTGESLTSDLENVTDVTAVAVKVNNENLYYKLDGNGVVGVCPIRFDMNNYKSAYRFASTPWFVSNVKGDFNHIEVNRLFRFHTITDGNNANTEIKVSIENIMPNEGVFDVVVRDVNDTDDAVVVLERFNKCNLVPSDSRFIGYRIGTSNGDYESQSKYITVELYEPNEGAILQSSVPCGFLGYPHGFVNGCAVTNEENVPNPPVLKYNCDYDEDVKSKKQYFGLSSRVGVDIDAFTFKGVAAYADEQDEYLSNGFHLDCRMDKSSYENYNTNKPIVEITVDGENKFTFDTVTVNSRTQRYDASPIIDSEEEMFGSIYEDVKLRKFTAYFYGGFDGWDVYRNARTNTDDFKATKYRGDYSETTGEGYMFDKIQDLDSLNLNQSAITSDFYAYLAAYRKFANPEYVDINIFATPGIDLVNNKLLSQEVIEMIEQERADSIYVATTPDKPYGASDFEDEMYTPEDIVYSLEDTEIDSNYTCTYYPWVKYFDSDNSQYIYLPPTKDVVRNMAQTDNTTYPWFAPAGLERGDVQCVRAHYITRLADEDVLYGGRINPVKTFAADGVKIWGQKNLQKADGQLNRIAVRRLLLRMRKLVSIACLGLIFSPNDTQTKQSLLGILTPLLDNIRANRGISDYRVEISDSGVNLEDRRELNARILFKPYSALEYISLEFAVTPESVSFDDV